MLLMEVRVGDLLRYWAPDRIHGRKLRVVLVLNVIPVPTEHGGPNVSILDMGTERHIRSSQLRPIKELGG